MQKPPASSRPCCCVRRAPASKAAPTRSCATSLLSVCLVCPAISASTRTFRSTRSRPRGDLDPHPEEPRSGVSKDEASWFETAQAPPHHEGGELRRERLHELR